MARTSLRHFCLMRRRALTLAAAAMSITSITSITSCVPLHSGAGSASATTSSLAGAYDSAVRDAAVYWAEHVYRPHAIARGTDSVTVVAWTPAKFRGGYAQDSLVLVGRDGLWVTLVPEVHDSCSTFPEAERQLRVEELLGLPPDTAPRICVLLRASTRDVFRPCPDADPSTPTCDEFPSGPVDSAHAVWIEQQALSAYQLLGGYPWARLGYTYNWRPGSARHGASEYVIRRGARVRVLSVIDTEPYCRAGDRVIVSRSIREGRTSRIFRVVLVRDPSVF